VHGTCLFVICGAFADLVDAFSCRICEIHWLGRWCVCADTFGTVILINPNRFIPCEFREQYVRLFLEARGLDRHIDILLREEYDTLRALSRATSELLLKAGFKAGSVGDILHETLKLFQVLGK